MKYGLQDIPTHANYLDEDDQFLWDLGRWCKWNYTAIKNAINPDVKKINQAINNLDLIEFAHPDLRDVLIIIREALAKAKGEA